MFRQVSRFAFVVLAAGSLTMPGCGNQVETAKSEIGPKETGVGSKPEAGGPPDTAREGKAGN